ncbi:hypothetical protein HPO96_18245 [Kribbella sandramycini]|uniref:Uncharacterized protein n=1 Tax=Kribbella sandramycini TaxID=60450 RepID=A0A7Y4L0R5_9ACTN|nr:hypothetical protein [Kribbella sandramycini]MBB6564485.1 hypothetical protein [Kribbella sandramycini]NOL42189.1 hypothetical protein [Kribbella sandramycini]
MTYYIAGNTAVENSRTLSQSALPNAPQQPHEEHPQRLSAARARLGAALRAAAARELRMAERLDPSPSCR